MPTVHLDPAAPTEEESRLAEESSRQLAPHLSRLGALQIEIIERGVRTGAVTIPPTAVRLLARILSEMARGNTMTLVPVQAELSSQQAADFLNVSRPYLIKLLEQCALPYRRVGAHGRLLLQDVIDYKRRIEDERHAVLDELQAQAQELGMGYWRAHTHRAECCLRPVSGAAPRLADAAGAH